VAEAALKAEKGAHCPGSEAHRRERWARPEAVARLAEAAARAAGDQAAGCLVADRVAVVWTGDCRPQAAAGLEVAAGYRMAGRAAADPQEVAGLPGDRHPRAPSGPRGVAEDRACRDRPHRLRVAEDHLEDSAGGQPGTEAVWTSQGWAVPRPADTAGAYLCPWQASPQRCWMGATPRERRQTAPSHRQRHGCRTRQARSWVHTRPRQGRG